MLQRYGIKELNGLKVVFNTTEYRCNADTFLVHTKGLLRLDMQDQIIMEGFYFLRKEDMYNIIL